MLGTVISLGVIINIYTGINVYIKRTSRSATLWTILFTAEVSVIAFLYLLQDKWEYLQKQGVILGNVPITLPNREIPERLNQKELFLEPCGKLNALQNLFDWYGILYYLFFFFVAHFNFVFWCLHFMGVEGDFTRDCTNGNGVHASKSRVQTVHPTMSRIFFFIWPLQVYIFDVIRGIRELGVFCIWINT